jgi:chemotaxis signal transduction protein
MQILHPKFKNLRTQTPQVPTIKALAIEIQDLKLAIPLELLVKVIRTPTVFKSGDKWMGMTHLDQESLLVLDLYQKIYGTTNPQPIENLVIIRDLRNGNDRLLGIPVSQLPTMVSLPTDQMQSLPSDYRDRDTLGIASHIVILNQGDQTETLFLLDPDRLLQDLNKHLPSEETNE